jgi:predicted DNA-binding transcriptional regulator YafY
MPVRPIPRPKVPRVGRPSGRFTQHRRIDLLREKLEAHTSGLTLDELAVLLRITTRSVRRYLHELSLVTELESIALRPGGAHLWRIKPSERGRSVVLRRTQAVALLAARRVFDVLKGSALFDEIDLALREIEQIARRPASRSSPLEPAADARLEDRFAYVPSAAHTYANRTEDVDEVFRAVAELRVMRFRFRDVGEDQRERIGRVTAHPYALVMNRGAIACVARDTERAQLRVFPMHRMSDVEASEAERFELPAEFSLRDCLHGDFGVAPAGRTFKLLVEFDPRAADGVRARRVHPSQKVAVAPDGRVRVSMQVPESPEVIARVRSWVLAFGAAAHVLEPRELAEEIAAELQRAAERYREPR